MIIKNLTTAFLLLLLTSELSAFTCKDRWDFGYEEFHANLVENQVELLVFHKNTAKTLDQLGGYRCPNHKTCYAKLSLPADQCLIDLDHLIIDGHFKDVKVSFNYKNSTKPDQTFTLSEVQLKTTNLYGRSIRPSPYVGETYLESSYSSKEISLEFKDHKGRQFDLMKSYNLSHCK